MELLSWIFQYFQESIKIFIISYGIMRFKIEKKEKSIIAYLLGLLIVIIGYLITDEMGVIVSLGSLCLIMIMNNQVKDKIILFLWYLGVTIVDSIVCGLGIVLLNCSIDGFFTHYLIDSLFNGITILLLFLIWKVKEKCGEYIYKSISTLYFKRIVIVFVGLIGVMLYISPIQVFFLEKQNGTRRIIDILGLSIGSTIFLIVIVVLILVYNQKRYYYSLHIMEDRLLKEQKKYYGEKMQREEETKKFRHDIKRHLNSILNLYEKNEYDKFIAYVERMLGKMEVRSKVKMVTGNDIVDIVVADMMSYEDKIVLEWSGKFPQKVRMLDIDICTLFSNLLSNAIEATKQVEEIRQNIKVTIKYDRQSLMISMQNPVKDKVDISKKKLMTSKIDKEKHGYGVKNIVDVIEKYNGFINFKCNEDEFFVEILFINII